MKEDTTTPTGDTNSTPTGPYVYSRLPNDQPIYSVKDGVASETNLGAINTSESSVDGRKGFLGMGGSTRAISDIGMDLKDFDSTKLDSMKNAVRTYRANIDGVLTNIQKLEENDYDLALFGSSQKQKVSEYVNACVIEIKKITHFIYAFEVGLTQVYNNYTAKNSTINVSAVEPGANALGKTGEEFTGIQGFGG